jgi:hypothetical protein
MIPEVFFRVKFVSMKSISRREFLKLSGLALGGLALNRFQPGINPYDDGTLVRVATTSVSVYQEPSDQSRIVGTWPRDSILHVYDTVTADTPAWNPIWYRVWGGYMWRGRLQRVRYLYNEPLREIPNNLMLAEVTVPFSQSYRFLGQGNWKPIYRLYYETVHWVVGIDPGPDGKPWYRLLDELLEINYHVPATDLRPIMAYDMTPISPDVPHEKKRIEVSLANQTVTCYENGQAVQTFTISSGLAGLAGKGETPTSTPTGNWFVTEKMPSKHMGDGNLASDIEAYELPGVAWSSFFTTEGHAFHGTYWHDNFGTPMSHGCINMRTADAKWLFRWTRPRTGMEDLSPTTLNTIGYGTIVHIY